MFSLEIIIAQTMGCSTNPVISISPDLICQILRRLTRLPRHLVKLMKNERLTKYLTFHIIYSELFLIIKIRSFTTFDVINEAF